MRKVKLALIGVGDMGSAHCTGFDHVPSCEITWICDPNVSNRERALSFIQNNSPQACDDYRDLVGRQDVEAVVISVPNYLHREVAVPFLERGIPVFLEKPVAATLQDCDEIIQAAKRSNAILQIGLVYRYSRIYNRMAQEVQAGRFGQVTMMWCKEFRDAFPPADLFYDENKSGGTLVEKDCHHFDIFNWMIGSRPVRVFASGGQHVYKNGTDSLITNCYTHYPAKVINDSTILDHAWVVIDYENGSKANLGLCMYLKPYNCMDEGLEIGLIGSNGMQMVAKKDQHLGIYGGVDETKETIQFDVHSDSISDGHVGGQRQRLEFMDSILTGKQPLCNGLIGREALLIAVAAEQSIKTGRPVMIDEIDLIK